MRVAALFLIAACASAPPPKPEAAPAATAPAVAAPAQLPAGLRGDIRTLPRERVRLRVDAPLRWSDGGPAVEYTAPPVFVEGPADVEAVVIDESAASVHVRVDGFVNHLMVWVDRAALQPVVVRETAIATAGATKPNLALRPGAPIETESETAGRARVRLVSPHLELVGDIDAAAIGWAYTPGERHEPADDEVDLAGDTVLRAAAGPNAPMVATVKTGWSVRFVGKPQGGWQEVELDDDVLRGRAFVPVGSDATGGFGISQRHPKGPVLLAGTCLYDRPKGAIVGAMSDAIPVAVRAAEDGWQWATISFRDAKLEVAIRAGDEPRCPVD